MAVPIRCGKEIVGAMALRLDQGGLLLASADIHFAENLAGFLSTLLELNNLDREIELRRQAESKSTLSPLNMVRVPESDSIK